MDRLFQDLRFGVRLLRRNPLFATTALLTLTVCIAANTAIFAVVNSVLLKPLPVSEPERLVLMYNSYPRAGVARAANAVPDYYDRLREVDAFDEVAAYNTRGLTIGTDGSPQRILGMLATPSLLRMLGVQPVLGRIFTEQEGELGRASKVILTYAMWQELFPGNPDPVGRHLRISGDSYEIVGVLPEGVRFADADVQLWLPLAFGPEERADDNRHSNNWSMVGRLRAGATVAHAQHQLAALNARNMERFPALREILASAGFHTVAVPLQEDMVGGVRRVLYLLWAGVLFVLLIGAVNITNLVLVRSTGRLRELATRHALGAELTRLTRQLLTETVLLTLAGGAAGFVVGRWGLALLVALGLDRMPRGAEVTADTRVLLFTLGLALLVGVTVGLVPVWQIRRMNLSQAFREDGRLSTAGRGAATVRGFLVACQIAFAFVLLAGAGLLLASFQRVLAIDPGFEPSGVLTARVAHRASPYRDATIPRTFSEGLLARLQAIPGVERAAITSNLPFGGDYSDSVILAEGYQMKPGESLISPFTSSVSPDYFSAMRIPVRAGRAFRDSDTAGQTPVVIVDETLARHFWGSSDPIGRRMFKPDSAQDITRPGPDAQWFTVVGVVGSIRMSGLVETENRIGAYYFPLGQQPSRVMTLVIRAAGDPDALVPSIRRELTALDPELPLYGVLDMQGRIDRTLTDRRTPMVLATTFGAVALFLAAIGIYGVLAYQVSQRTREIAIRIALGSGSSAIFRLVLRDGAVLLGAGLLAGVGGAFAVRRFIESQLYGVGTMDPLVLGTMAAVLASVAALACIVPAWRAAHIDPLTAMNEQ